MIDNIILLITGTLHQRQISELRGKCHPLGSFEEMESINIATTPADLYSAVLVDTPLGTTTFTPLSPVFIYFFLGQYFKHCVSETDLDELNIEVIRNTLYKVCHFCTCTYTVYYIYHVSFQQYLEDFHKFCQNIGGDTAEVMGKLLAVRLASCHAQLFISVTCSLRQTEEHSLSLSTPLALN